MYLSHLIIHIRQDINQHQNMNKSQYQYMIKDQISVLLYRPNSKITRVQSSLINNKNEGHFNIRPH